MVITLLKVYVDDGRQVTSILRKGMRFCQEEGKFVWREEAEKEDRMKEEQGESKEAFMARLCLPAMNGINPDLTFTVETAEEFRGNKLPTLDFKLWVEEEDLTWNHTYFEKEMRTQLLIPERSEKDVKHLY